MAEGRQLISGRAYAAAEVVLARGLALTDRSRIPTLDRYLPRSQEVGRAWTRSAGGAGPMAEELQGLAEHDRFLHGIDLTRPAPRVAGTKAPRSLGGNGHTTGSWRGAKGA